MKKTNLLFSALALSSFFALAQNEKMASLAEQEYASYFQEAYQQYPNIPTGVLEAVAYTNSRMHHISHNAGDSENCMGMPNAYGVMGLVLDGKNYFSNNLVLISNLSGITTDAIINDPEQNILAYASALDAVMNSSTNKKVNSIENISGALAILSELPHKDVSQKFALNTQLYSYLTFLNDASFQAQYNFPDYHFDLQSFFGEENFRVLSSSNVTIQADKISDANGNAFKGGDVMPMSTDYPPALWVAAASCNYSSRTASVTAVVIHDVEGSYSSCISWFQNCSASVSAHYVVRSSDGQITQMVLESKKAWHVGSENGYTIGIEHEGYQAQTGWYTTAMYTASANLVKDICTSGYGINPTTCWNGPSCSGICVLSSSYKIKGHQHYPNQTHNDPGPNWNWGTYYGLINNTPPPPPPTPPTNDNCSAAISLTPNTTCVSTAGTLANATTSGLAKASCDVSSSSTLKDVWYKFTATATTHTITLTPSSGLDAVLSLYSACSGTQLGCSDNGGGPGGVEKIIKTGLTVGTTYYARIYSYGSSMPSTTTFNICVTGTSAPPPPANDNCANAVSLTPNTSCVVTSGTIANATVSGMTKASCDASSASSLKDVWYKFTATASTQTITLTPSSGLDAVLSLYTTCSGSQLGCSDNGGGPGGTEKINASALTVGNTYYVRIYSYGSSIPTTTTFNICVTSPSSNPPPPPPVDCAKTLKTTIEGFNVYQHTASGAIMYKAKMAIDADGSPRAYGPNNSGLDYTANAGSPGNWWGVVTDNSGNPIIQDSSDPYPGMYVSTTSLTDNAYSSTKTQHYVNSEAIPFFVLPSAVTAYGIHLGDVGYVYNTTNGQGCYAIFADGGPSGKLGEGSIYLANQLGINSNPKTGGTSSGIIDYIVFPNSGLGQGTIPTVAQINSMGAAKLNAAGGTGITSCLPLAPPQTVAEREAENNELEKIVPAEENSFILYPNPFDGGALHGKFSEADSRIMSVKIYDMTGREIFSKEVSVENGEFSLSFDEKLKTGMYLLVGTTNDKQYTKRIVVQ
ncbi:MAG: N-acetylmuramoyl-L-alanine amidase [Bacteroidetes bacterium]|nr:N-acetylmuramoyl-L-alanine amidase [Bacteroidota bacterium]